MKEVGLSGSLDPAPKAVGVGTEQAPGTAPLLTILNAALVKTPFLKHVRKTLAVSIGINIVLA